MKRFHFPLDRVLRFRQMAVETEQARLEQALAAVRAIDAQREALRAQSEEVAGHVRGLEQPGEVPVAVLEVYPTYRFAVRRAEQVLAERRRQAEAAVEKQRAALVAARQAHEVLERAREMARRRWQAEFDREQEQLASELYLARWRRNRE